MDIETARTAGEPGLSVQDVVEECEGLDHAARNAFLANFGRQDHSPATVSTTAETLTKGSVYERLMGLQIAVGSGDVRPAFEALANPSIHLQRRAIHIIACSASDDDIEAHAPHISKEIKDRLIRHLHRGRRFESIDYLLSLLASEAPNRYVQLVAYGSDAYVRAHISEVVNKYVGADWRKFATMHSALALETMIASLPDATYDRQYLWNIDALIAAFDKVGYTGGSLVPIADALVMQDKGLLHGWPAFAKRHPSEYLRLCMSGKLTPPHYGFKWSMVAKKLSIEELVGSPELIEGEKSRSSNQLYWNSHHLSLSRRRELWEKLGKPTKSSIFIDIYAIMPREERFARIREQLAEDVGEDRGKRDLRYALAAMLPWEESMTYNADGLKSRDIDVRRARLKQQIERACMLPENTEPALKLMIRHRNEQDNVWSAMLRALQNWPCKCWNSSNLKLFADIIDLSLNSSSASRFAFQGLAKVVSKIALQEPVWAIEHGVRIFNRDPTSVPSKSSFLDVKATEVIEAMVEQALPQLTTWARPNTNKHITCLIRWLGPGVSRSNLVKEALLDVITSSRDMSDVNDALQEVSVLYRVDIPQLIPRLLNTDETYTIVPMISYIVQEKQQSLLNHYLSPVIPAGRLNPEKSHREPNLHCHLHKWTRSQQDTYASLLLEEIKSSEVDVSKIPQYIDTLSRLDFSTKAAEGIKTLAGGEAPLTRDPAIRKLARLDSDRGLETLLQALEDDRGRVAIFSAKSYFNRLSSDEALKLLARLKSRSVTVKKEIIRLVGEIGSPQACDLLLKISRTDDLHNDLMIPLITRFWTFVNERPAEVSAFLKRTVRHEEKDIAKRSFESHPEALSDAGKSLLIELLQLGLAHPAEYVVTAALSRIEFTSLKDYDLGEQIPQTVITMVRETSSPSIRKKATTVLMCRFLINHLSSVLDLLREAMTNRLIFTEFFAAIISSNTLHTNAATIVPKILDILATDSIFKRFQFQLMVKFPVGAVIFRRFLDVLASGHADDLTGVIGLIRNQWSGARFKKVDLKVFEEVLRRHGSPNCRRLGVAVLEMLAKNRNEGWSRQTEEWGEGRLEILEQYRNDAEPLVRDAAIWIIVPEK